MQGLTLRQAANYPRRRLRVRGLTQGQALHGAPLQLLISKKFSPKNSPLCPQRPLRPLW
jgi:hypothetical protein